MRAHNARAAKSAVCNVCDGDQKSAAKEQDRPRGKVLLEKDMRNNDQKYAVYK